MLNRLKDLACYLSGPIDFAEQKGSAWRDEITPFLEEMNVRVFNPLKHCFYGTSELDEVKRPRMAQLLREEKYVQHREEMKDIAHWDLRCVDLSSFMIVNYNDDITMCGTYDEIFTANRQNKPVLLKLSGHKCSISSWLHGRFPPEHMFESWDDIREYLDSVNSNSEYLFTEADSKRWLFFDGEHMG